MLRALGVMLFVMVALGLLELSARTGCCELFADRLVLRGSGSIQDMQVRPPSGDRPFYRWRPNVELQGRPFTNNLGFVMERDVATEKPGGATRVVMLGASTTQGRPTHQGTNYPAVAQQRLRDEPDTAGWEVINAGHQGYGMRDVLALLSESVLPLRPDVVTYYGEINDVAAAKGAPYKPAEQPVHIRAAVSIYDELRRRSALWSYYIAPYAGPHLPWTGAVDTYDWPTVLRDWEDGLHEILNVAREHGIKVMLITYAYAVNEGQPATRAMRLYGDQGGWPAMRDPVRQFREGIEEQNRILLRAAATRGVPVVHAAEQLNGRAELFEDLVHMTTAGYTELGALVAAGLVSREAPPAVPGPDPRPRPPKISEVRYHPATEAEVGQTVEVTVVADTERSELQAITLSVNTATDGSTSGEWVLVGSRPVAGNAGAATFQWNTAGLQPGQHRIAINVHLANGETLFWYQQPSHAYLLK